MIIGLTGTNGAGKGAVAEILGGKGFEYYSLSDEIREEVRKRGMGEGLDNLIAVGNELRAKEGPATLGKRVLKKIGKSKKKDFVVDSIRNPAEIKELKKNKNFILMAIDAPIGLRYKRVAGRKRASDFVSFEKFRQQENVQLRGGKTGQQLVKCMEMADYTIMNDGTIDELKKKVDDVIKVA